MLVNTNASFNSDGTLSFVPERSFVLDYAHSVGNAKVDRIIIPNIPLIVSILETYLYT